MWYFSNQGRSQIQDARIEYRDHPKSSWMLWAIYQGTKAQILEVAKSLLAEIVMEVGPKRAAARIVWESGKVQRVRLLSAPSFTPTMNPWEDVGISDPGLEWPERWWVLDTRDGTRFGPFKFRPDVEEMNSREAYHRFSAVKEEWFRKPYSQEYWGQPNPRDFSVLGIPEDPAKMAEMAQRIAAEGWKRVDELGQRHEPTLLDGAALDRNKMLYASVWKQIMSAAKHLNKSRMAWALYRGGKGTVNWASAPKGMMARELTHNVFGFHVHGHIALEAVALVQPLEVLFNQRMFDEIVQKLQAEPATGKGRPMFGQGAPFGTSWLRRQPKI